MKMKLTDLASIAEIIAAIGVIFSLIFVRIGIINSTPDFLMLRRGRGVYLLFSPS
jgi:hypothetical protein